MDNKRQRILKDLDIFLSSGKVSALSVLVMLSGHDVVIKVEGHSPDEEDYDYCGDEAFDDGQRSMIEAGYTATEPLI